MSEEVLRYYRNRVLSATSNSLQWQVGKTVDGIDVPADQIEIILNSILHNLTIEKGESVLDIGCGNGLLTKKVANENSSSHIVGLELTPELYDVAIQHSMEKHVEYLNENVFDYLCSAPKTPFTKIYLYEVVQHFSHREVDRLFELLAGACGNNTRILIGGIPDLSRIWNFYSNEERIDYYYSGLISEENSVGTWFHPNFFEFLATRHGFQYVTLEQEKTLYTSHYRYDGLFLR